MGDAYACVIRIRIGVVALLARIDDAVSASWKSQGALVRTAVAIVRITIVALFYSNTVADGAI